MKQRWVRSITSVVLALAMVIAGLGPWSGGLMAVEAAETELFTNTAESDWTVDVADITKAYDNGALTLTNSTGDGKDVVVSQEITLESGVTPTCTVTATSSDSVWVNAYDNEKWQSPSVQATAVGAELSWTASNSGNIGWSIWMPDGTSVTLSGMSLKVTADDSNKDDGGDGGDDSYDIVYYKEDFNNTEATGWNSEWTDTSTSITDKVEGNCWNVWSDGANSATFTRSFENLPVGNYTMSFVTSGGKMGTCTIKLADKTNTVSTDITVDGKNTTDVFNHAAAGTITATITCEFNGGGWLHFDDMVLSIPVTLAEKIAHEKAQLQEKVTACADYQEGAYTADSWAALQAALTGAQAVLDNADAQVDSITTALEALEATMNGLKESGIFVKKVENLSEDFICGADISSYVSVTQSGAKFKDAEGNELNDAQFFTLLKNSGINYVRIKIWNDPYTSERKGYGGGNSDLEKAKTIGKLATDAGMKVLIDFHYSDFWADPERQYAPKAWKDYTVAQKEEALYNFTKESLQALKANGVDVGMVQVGNETNNGIAGVSEWEDRCKLFSAGSRAIREIDSDILVAVHFTDPQTIGFFDEVTAYLAEYEVDYDVFATSYYPNIHGSMANLTSVLVKIAQTHNKKVMVAETSWAWTTKDGDGHSQSFDPGTNSDYNISVQGQATLIRDVVEAVNNVNKTVADSAIGVFYWEPTWIPVQYAYDAAGNRDETIYQSNQAKWEEYGSGWASSFSDEYDHEHGGLYYGGSVKDNEAFFDFEGNPLASLTVFKDLREGRQGPVVKLEVIKDGTAEILLDSSDVTTKYAEIKAGLPKSVTAIFNDGSRVPFTATWNAAEVDTKVTDFGTYRISGTASGSYQGKSYSGDVECEILVMPNSILTNGDFESGSTGWEVANADNVDIKWNDTPVRGEGAMHFYSGSDMNFTMSQTVTVNRAGKYCATMQLQGGDGSAEDDINISVTNQTSGDSVKANAQLKGWKVWQKPITERISAAAGDRVTVTITVKSIAGAWGSVDDVFLYLVEAANSGSSASSGGTTQTPSAATTTTETTTEDGTTVVTTTTTNADGSKTETVTATAADGSKTETKTETAANGEVIKTTEKVTASDGSAVEKVSESEVNASGKEVDVTTTTKTDATGKVTSVTEKSVIAQSSATTSTTVTVKKDGEGEITSAKASITKTLESGNKTTIPSSVVGQITEAAGTQNVTITMTVKDKEGKTKYKVTVESEDLTAGNELYIYKLDTKKNEYVMVNAKTYEVNDKGNVSVSMSKNATYALVDKETAKKIDKEIKAAIKPKKGSATVKTGKSTTFKLSDKANKDNIKSITYTTSNKSVATVNKNGKIVAKKKGTVTIKAKVTLKNGTTKTIKMKIKVK